MSSLEASTWNILNFSDEILIYIFIHLDAKNRLSLGNSCKRFHNLVFREKTLLRNLDFSEHGYLTSLSDLRPYLNDKKTYLHIQQLNIENMYSTRVVGLFNRIGKMQNLVSLNIIGVDFRDVEQMEKCLKPLKHLRRLSVNWPTETSQDRFYDANCRREPFCRLKYLMLCVQIHVLSLKCICQICWDLEELHYLHNFSIHSSHRLETFSMNMKMQLCETRKLTKLKVFACCIDVRNARMPMWGQQILDLLPDIDQWMSYIWHDATGINHQFYCYLEKNPEIYNEPSLSRYVDRNPTVISEYIKDFGSKLLGTNLLRDAIRANNGIELNDSLCVATTNESQEWFLTIKEYKLLLRNPKHTISFLNLQHDITPRCRDGCLIGTPFPNLRKLVLMNIVTMKRENSEQAEVAIGFKKRRVGWDNTSKSSIDNASFQKLIEHAPGVEDLTICGRATKPNEIWDIDALNQITKWQNLTALTLANIPIKNGRFLLEIVTKCRRLSKLKLESLGTQADCCYKREIIETLRQCHNLQDFSIQQKNIGRLSDVFYALSTNKHLRRVHVNCLGSGIDTDELIPAINRMVYSTNVILLVCDLEFITQVFCQKLKSELERTKNQLKRLGFEFHVTKVITSVDFRNHSTCRFVHRDLLWPCSEIVYLRQLQFL